MQFILYPQNFVEQNTICPFIKIDKFNYTEYLHLVKECINLFNTEIEWDGMYTADDAIQYFENGYFNFVLISDNIIYGYFWMNGDFLQNVFMRNIGITKKWKGREFISHIINTQYKDIEITNYIDDWNEKSIKLFKSLGFLEKNNIHINKI